MIEELMHFSSRQHTNMIRNIKTIKKNYSEKILNLKDFQLRQQIAMRERSSYHNYHNNKMMPAFFNYCIEM